MKILYLGPKNATFDFLSFRYKVTNTEDYINPKDIKQYDLSIISMI